MGSCHLPALQHIMTHKKSFVTFYMDTHFQNQNHFLSQFYFFFTFTAHFKLIFSDKDSLHSTQMNSVYLMTVEAWLILKGSLLIFIDFNLRNKKFNDSYNLLINSIINYIIFWVIIRSINQLIISQKDSHKYPARLQILPLSGNHSSKQLQIFLTFK